MLLSIVILVAGFDFNPRMLDAVYSYGAPRIAEAESAGNYSNDT